MADDDLPEHEQRDQLIGLLADAVRHLDRIATVLELATAPAVDPSAEAERGTMSDADLERFDELTPEQQEFAAVIEELEAEGKTVPAAAYRSIGLDPPQRETEPTEEELNQEAGDEAGDDAGEGEGEGEDDLTVARRKD